MVLKEKVMATFLEKFQLTQEEVLALKGTPGSRIGEDWRNEERSVVFGVAVDFASEKVVFSY